MTLLRRPPLDAPAPRRPRSPRFARRLGHLLAVAGLLSASLDVARGSDPIPDPPAADAAVEAAQSPPVTKPAPGSKRPPAPKQPAGSRATPGAAASPSPGEGSTTPAPGTEAELAIRQPEARNPLGYPESLGSGPSVLPAFPRRADEPQVPGGLDPYRAPEYAEDPDGLLAWFQEPFPASHCDRHVVDPAWMGPGEYAYHLSPNRCWCSRDHTRMFRMNYMGRLWVAPELLLWSTSGNSITAPLVTSSPAGTPPAQAGVIGQPGTSLLFGDQWAPGTFRPGGRITVGYWFDPTQHDGIDAQYFQLADAVTQGTFTNQGGSVLLARPYVDATTGNPAAVLLPPPNSLPADPALLDRSITARQDTSFQGFDLLYRRSLCCDLLHRRWLVGGYRFLQLNDNLSVVDSSTVSTGVPGGFPSTSILSTDAFSAKTQFHGGEVGWIEKWWWQRVGFQLLGKMALGGSFYDTDIGGTTVTSVTAASGATPTTTTTPGSVLAQPTNTGNFGASSFAAVGELGASVDWAIWSQCRFSVGYTFLWWSQVARAASQVDTSVNPTQFPPGPLSGPAAPAYHLRTNDFWAQGLNLGLEYQF